MNNSELVSVIMPMHNSARFVGKAIESVLAQTYSCLELLVVDDQSTDESCQIVKKYQSVDARVVLLSNDHHTGKPSAPRNMGVTHARGRYIAFLDSDDLWYPSKLEQQLTLFEDSRVAIVYSNYEKIDEDGNGANRIVKAPSTVNYRKLLLGNVIGNLTGIYDTGKVGVIPFMDIHHEDYVLWLTILKRGYIAKNTSTTTAAYRILVSSVSSNKFRTMSWQWNIYRNIERIGFLQSCYYFVNYAIRAYMKRTI